MLELNDIKCPFCLGDKLFRYRAVAHDADSKLINIVECVSCSAGWQWPLQRTAAQSEQIFDEAYTTQVNGSYFDRDRRESVAASQVAHIQSKLRTAGRLLDVGCGDGTFARKMAGIGWQSYGLDPALHKTITENHAGGYVKLCSDNLADLPDEDGFDLITLWDVVEHVEKPDQLLSDAFTRLKPGGLMIVETGNYQCTARLCNASTWWNFQMDHRWYLAPPQLRTLLESIGLEHVDLADQVLRPWWHGHMDTQPPTMRSLVKALVLKPSCARQTWKLHQRLSDASTHWHGWSGLEIMTMSGRKPFLS
jgi:predicted TPR repeat methyltransferase